jgi:hypothetical protein
MTDDSTDHTAGTSDVPDDEAADPSENEEPIDTSSTVETDGAGSSAESVASERGGGLDRDVESYVEWGAFAVLATMAVVATYRFYVAVSRAIDVWFSSDFVPVFQAAFNLVVLFACAIGISLLVRRLR